MEHSPSQPIPQARRTAELGGQAEHPRAPTIITQHQQPRRHFS